MLIKLNNFGAQHLNKPRYLFHSFCCTTRCIFEPLSVFEPGFSMDKYGIQLTVYYCMHGTFGKQQVGDFEERCTNYEMAFTLVSTVIEYVC